MRSMAVLTLSSWSHYYNLTKPKVVALIAYLQRIGIDLFASDEPVTGENDPGVASGEADSSAAAGDDTPQPAASDEGDQIP